MAQLDIKIDAFLLGILTKKKSQICQKYDLNKRFCSHLYTYTILRSIIAKIRERTAHFNAAVKNKARLRNRARRARSPTTFLYGKDGSEIATTRIWVSMHCGATLLTQSAALRRHVAVERPAEVAFTLTKIDTLSDRLL